jgi:SAM-dependent methyltransferase
VTPTDLRVRNSQFAYYEALTALLPSTTAWLDLGCGHQVVPDWVAPRIARPSTCMALGIDADFSSLRSHRDLDFRIAANIERLPLKERAFDLVTANMVVEHVRRPERLFVEVQRVLRPGGIFLVHTPNAHGYTTRLARAVPPPLKPLVARLLQGRREEDVYPTHYRANTLGDLRRLAISTSFRVEDVRAVASSPQFFRVPVLSSMERGLLRAIAADGLERWRPCIIGRFVRT